MVECPAPLNGGAFRIRQGDLPPVDPTTDIRIPSGRVNIHTTVCATVSKIQEVLGVDVPLFEKYRAGGQCWASAAAEQEITFRKAAQAARRQEKAERLTQANKAA